MEGVAHDDGTILKIAESLATKYDVIYYVDAEEGTYSEFKTNEIYGNLEIKTSGIDFYKDAEENSRIVLHPADRQRLLSVLKKDFLISVLEHKRKYRMDYRMLILDQVQYTRLTATWATDHIHFIIGVENITQEVEKEQKQLNALNSANEMARRDELTGTKNKNAYQELEEELQERIEKEMGSLQFGLVVCDLNNLKKINDSLGHRAGDEYICSFSRMVCDVFEHSPVYRVGGDEFVVFLKNRDYQDRETLFTGLRRQILDNLEKEDGSVAATGMSVYDAAKDRKVADVFDRADNMMYADKRRLKERCAPENVLVGKAEGFVRIPAARKGRLDELFNAFSIVAEGSYVYLCDMKYDFSRWTKIAVDSFGLPGEYMYRAGEIWEEHIHPDDREVYHNGINAIFSGNALGHDMQYRARRLDGNYDVCTCRGVVIRNALGEPEYFGGVIRNHGEQRQIDTLTGLRNQYGFFEDMRRNINSHHKLIMYLIGIRDFSEINEMYGYRFGNLVLQKFGRKMFEHLGNNGIIYRMDGTKFAIISNTLQFKEAIGNYEDYRNIWRSGVKLDGKNVILEMSAGALMVEHFDIDEQTMYACLSFAYKESKVRRQGDMVEFYNNLNENKQGRMEKIYAIRTSITHGFRGFYLLFQPVVDAKTDELIGAEALIRWKDEQFGIVPPDLFIPILENDTLFPELGRWILQSALLDIKPLLKKYPDFIVNVNLSYSQLEKKDFLDTVYTVLEETDFPPEHLCLEITERCRLLDIGLLNNIIVNLQGRGVKVALDDFGTGFSSIGLLKDLPFDIIKIDRSFIQHVDTDEKEKKLISHFTQLAETFEAKICVEGIETEAMRDALRKFHIQSFQGYYYAKPMPIEELRTDGWKKKK
ncbi:MAG: EAL domain-containing protein [Lachnospiraceae bacterium]|nr:EAL domain-containing protein [Lachnospiraceae bacterium]